VLPARDPSGFSQSQPLAERVIRGFNGSDTHLAGANLLCRHSRTTFLLLMALTYGEQPRCLVVSAVLGGGRVVQYSVRSYSSLLERMAD
jgi:hypothetical protein